MVAFCQVSSTAGSKLADGRRRAGAGGRLPAAAVEPRLGAGGRAGQLDSASRPTRRGAGQGGRTHRRGEPSSAPCDGPRMPPRGRQRRRLLRTAAGRAAAPGPGWGASGGGARAGRHRRPGNSAHRTKEEGLRAAGYPATVRLGGGVARGGVAPLPPLTPRRVVAVAPCRARGAVTHDTFLPRGAG
nr:uncharacterized protein LOC106781655 isoform X1 [Equus caballus]